MRDHRAALAQRLRVPFADADDFHPPANIAKMTAGEALDDTDRHPWLEAIGEWLTAHEETGGKEKPAAVFMGDTGSLALGGTLGAIAVVAHHEFVLAIIGGLFVVEALSVIIQVAYFKRTGRRVFLMAPIHHHFEKKGWAEPQIVIRFWIISLILALIGLATLKVR